MKPILQLIFAPLLISLSSMPGTGPETPPGDGTAKVWDARSRAERLAA